MTDKAAEQDSTDETPFFPVPMGWTPEQITQLAPMLGERVMQAVRAAESMGWKVRCGSSPRVPSVVALIVLDERGEASRMKSDGRTVTPLCEAVSAHLVAYGLAIGTVGEYSPAVRFAPAEETSRASGDEASATAPARKKGNVAK